MRGFPLDSWLTRYRIERNGAGLPVVADFAGAQSGPPYKPIIDERYIRASREGSFALVRSWDGRHETRT